MENVLYEHHRDPLECGYGTHRKSLTTFLQMKLITPFLQKSLKMSGRHSFRIIEGYLKNVDDSLKRMWYSSQSSKIPNACSMQFAVELVVEAHPQNYNLSSS